MRGKERTPRHIVFGSETLLTGMNSRTIFKEQQKPTGASSGLFFICLNLCIYFGLCWVFAAARGISLLIVTTVAGCSLVMVHRLLVAVDSVVEQGFSALRLY